MYKIWLHEVPEKNIEEGWWGGNGRSRQNSVIYDRTEYEDEAFEMDDMNALLIYTNFKSLGWPCEVIPKITNKRKLEILDSGIFI